MKGVLYAVLGIVLAFSIVNLVHAAEYNGEHWQSTYLWYVDASCPAFVKNSVEEQLAKHSPVATQYVTVWNRGISQDSANVIYCGYSDVQETQVQLPLPYGLTSSVSETVAGRARWYHLTATQEIVECDVWLSSMYTNEDTVDRYVLHEVLGHCMGLRHSSEKDAVMYYAPRATSFHIDDYAGLTELYRLCRDSAFVDYKGNLYLARLDVEELLEALDDRQYDAYRGVELSAYLAANEPWPASVYNVKESACDSR